MIQNDIEMNEIIIINGYEYTNDEFDAIAAFVGLSLIHISEPTRP